MHIWLYCSYKLQYSTVWEQYSDMMDLLCNTVIFMFKHWEESSSVKFINTTLYVMTEISRLASSWSQNHSSDEQKASSARAESCIEGDGVTFSIWQYSPVGDSAPPPQQSKTCGRRLKGTLLLETLLLLRMIQRRKTSGFWGALWGSCREKREREVSWFKPGQDMSTNSACSLKLKAKLAANFYQRQSLHRDMENEAEQLTNHQPFNLSIELLLLCYKQLDTELLL